MIECPEPCVSEWNSDHRPQNDCLCAGLDANELNVIKIEILSVWFICSLEVFLSTLMILCVLFLEAGVYFFKIPV